MSTIMDVSVVGVSCMSYANKILLQCGRNMDGNKVAVFSNGASESSTSHYADTSL